MAQLTPAEALLVQRPPVSKLPLVELLVPPLGFSYIEESVGRLPFNRDRDQSSSLCLLVHSTLLRFHWRS